MNELTLGLCQIQVIDDKKANLKKAEEFLIKSHQRDAELVVLPEMFNCPYENSKFVEYAEEEEDSYTLNYISNLAQDYDLYIVAGSIPEKRADKIYNTCFFFNNKGK